MATARLFTIKLDLLQSIVVFPSNQNDASQSTMIIMNSTDDYMMVIIQSIPSPFTAKCHHLPFTLEWCKLMHKKYDDQFYPIGYENYDGD